MMLTIERLRELVDYDPKTGEFRWRFGTVGHKVNDPVGTIFKNKNCPYLRVKIDGKSYFLHILAWFYMTGKWPDNEIDHRNRNSLDNKWRNLRDITHYENVNNSPPLRVNNTSGFSGVIWHEKQQRWHVRFKGRHIGSYRDKTDAIGARLSC